MKTTFLKKLAIGIAMLCSPILTQAWGLQGHRITGQIADFYLTPKARLAIKAILGDETMAFASNWADFVRSDPNYSYLTPWHFMDYDKPSSSQAEIDDFLAHDAGTDAYTRLNFLIDELKKKDLSQEKRLLDLRMVIHIVEDLHQPLHTGYPDHKGGNDIKLTWFNDPTNLHTVWDSKIIDFQQLSYTEYANAINHTTATQRAEWQKAPISQWIYEANQITGKIYTDSKADAKLGYSYNFEYISTVNQQLLKGGVRLAGILNQLFG